MTYLPYLLLFAFSSLILISLAVYGWRHQSIPVAAPFALTLLLYAVWPLVETIDVTTADLPLKIFLMKVRLIASAFGAVAWLITTIRFTNRSSLLNRTRIVVLCLIPIALSILLVIGPETLMRYNYAVDLSASFPVLTWTDGPLMRIYLSYSYILFVANVVLLLRSLRTAAFPFNRQLLAVLAATLFPFVTELLFQLHLPLFPNFNLTPIALAASGLLLTRGIITYRLLDIGSIGRKLVIDGLSDGMLVLDLQNRIVDLNPAAERLMNMPATQIIGRNIGEVLATRRPDLIERYRDVLETQEEISIGEGATRHVIELRLSPLKDQRGSLLGRAIVLRDITERKQAEAALHTSEEQFRTLFENAPIGIGVADLHGNLLTFNDAILQPGRYSRAEMLKLGNVALLYYDAHQRAEALALFQQQGVLENYSVQFKRKDGTPYDTLLSLTHITFNGQPCLQAIVEDITERKRAEEALRAKDQELQTLFEVLPVGVSQINADGQITQMNPALTRIMSMTVEGLSSGAYRARQYIRGDGTPMPPAEFASTRAFAEQQTIYNVETGVIKEDGTTIWTSVNAAPLPDGSVVVATLDITERKQAEEQLHQHSQLLSALYENMLDILQFQKLDELLERIVLRATEMLNTPYGEIELLEGDELVVHAFTPNQSFLSGDRVPRTEARLSWQAVDTRQPVSIDDYATWPYHRPIYDRIPFHAVAIFPILSGDQCLGVFGLSRDRLGDIFTAEQIQIGQLFARLAALAIDNDQAYTKALAELDARKHAEAIIHQQNQLLQVLHKVAIDIGAQLDMSVLLRQSLARLVEMLKADRGGGIYLYAADQNALKLAQGTGMNANRLGLIIPIGEGVAGRVFQTGQPLIIDDYSIWPGHISTSVIGEPFSVLGVPLILEGRIIGSLNVFANTRRKFAQTDIDLAEMFAAQFVVAVRNAQLYEQAERELAERTRAEESARRQAQELALLGEVRTGLARELELADLFHVAVEATAKILGYHQVSLYLRQDDVLQLQHQVGYEHPFLEIPITWGVMARSVRTGEMIFLPDVRIDPEFIGAIDDVTSEVCVPLFDQYTAVGALNVETIVGTILTEADVRLLGALGEHISIAIGRARLYAKLRDSERRYKDLVDKASDIIYKTDAHGRFTFVNPVGQRIMGHPEAELLGRHYLKHIHPDYRGRAAQFYQQQFEAKTAQTYYEFPSVLMDGSVIWVGQNVQLVLNEAGDQIIETQVIAHDITELHNSRQRYKNLVDNASDIIYKITPTGYFTFVNPTALHIMGYAEAELIGTHYLKLIRLDYRKQAAHFYLHQFESQTPRTYFEFPALTKDGTVIWLGQNVQLILNPVGDQVVEAQAIARDITDLHQAEETLRRQAQTLSERNAELDAFAHTVAHDLKGLIGIITGYSEELIYEDSQLSPQEVKDTLRIIDRQGHKAIRIIDELMILSGARQQVVSPKPIEMGKIIDEAWQRLADASQEAKAEINLPDRASWPIALGYAPWIEEVWLNYLSNAIKYGGQPPQIEVGATSNDNGSVRFWVRDNGHGLTPEECDRLFVAFTRLEQARVQGHGLGLSIVKRIVEKLGGTVGVESEIGAGSTFYFTLPAARS
jgi:PAS domain S-box-containing protein